MASLYFDEDVAIAAAGILRNGGNVVRTTASERRISARDPDQLAYATDQGHIFVTHNRRDFHTLHDAWIQWSPRWHERQTHGGILILDHGPLPWVIAAAIQTFLTTAPATVGGLTFDWFARGGGVWEQWRL